MILKENEELKQYTTFKMGGIAKKFYIPESEEELVSLVRTLDNYKILGGGSNLLINNNGVFPNVIYTKDFNKEIINKGNGIYYFGSSVRLQKIINKINQDGYGGIEYLYSVPGMLGGAIYMNAGRGKQFNMQLTDYLIDVDVLVDGKVKKFTKEECKFDYRKSIFQDNNYVILGANFKFKEVDFNESKKLKKERIELCKNVQDNSSFNFGSVFCICNYKIMKMVSKLSSKNKKGIHFSNKTNNWLCNDGSGEFKQAIKLINRVKKIHKLFNKKIELEVRVWE